MAARLPFIDLDRRFRDLTDAEREDPEVLALYNDHDAPWSLGWEKLLDHPRVIILAEAGSGKTWEMREQVSRMVKVGRTAFFIPLESLQSDNPSNIFSPDEYRLYETWLVDDQSVGWFFLDALDELKLVHGTLERALRRLSREVEGRLGRVRVVLSSRPTDWRPITDLEAFERYLPLPETTETEISPDNRFMSAIRKNSDSDNDIGGSESATIPRIVALLPLGEQQITRFVQRAGIGDSDGFLAEVRRRDAWTFARRPLDLSELVAFWRTNGRLGARAEQHEANIKFKLKDDPSRPDRGVLSDNKARAGAERLALALELTRRRTIYAPDLAIDIEPSANAIDAADILPDWSDEERQVLIRRALFDPATYGRVRFHHRSVQEYLAAKRLIELRRRGMTAQAMRRLLFGERYGVPVVLPSAKAVAAWAGLWDEDVRNELMRREPEVLLTLGDPENLNTEARFRLLRAFTNAYGQGGDRGINIPIDEVRRLAHADLAPVIAELWATPQLAPDVKELLLELIWQGPVEPCAPIAADAALDPALPNYERTISVRALAGCGRKDLLAPIAAAMLDPRSPWPAPILHNAVQDLFPTYWTAGDLRRVIVRTQEPQNTVGGFSWTLRQLVPNLDPTALSSVRLRNTLAALIWVGRKPDDHWFEYSSRFGYLAPALADLCLRQLAIGPPSHSLLHGCAIAQRYGDDGYGSRDEVAALKAAFQAPPSLREAAFWMEVELSAKRGRADSADEQLFRAEYHGLIEPLGETDLSWLLATLTSSNNADHRALALEALYQLWWRRGSSADEMTAITNALSDDLALTARLAALTAPRMPNPVLAQSARKYRRSRLRSRRREQLRLDRWTTWRARLLSDPVSCFQPPAINETLANLYKWLRGATQSRSSYNVWDRKAIEQAYTPQIATLAADAFRAQWRTVSIVPLSQRSPDERNSTPWTWAWGLTGLAAEAEAGNDWALRLTKLEAVRAAGYAMVELNGFPHWAADLARHQPAAFDATVGEELTAQLALVPSLDYLPIFQDLNHGPEVIKSLLVPRVQQALDNWPGPSPDEQRAGRMAYHLGAALDIVLAVDDAAERPRLVGLCEQAFCADPNGIYSVPWLKALFRLSGPAGARALEGHLAELPAAIADARASSLLATLFGDPSGTALRFENSVSKVEALEGLIRLAYRHVRSVDDNRHDGVFSPDERDKAEYGRSFLIGLLFDTRGPEARALIIKLAEDPLFSDWPDRLRLIARRRAASDAEGEPLTPGEITILEARLEAPPHDRDTLFQVMLDRISDIAHDLAHDDFSDRRTLRTVADEAEMQRTLAGRLRHRAEGAYVVVREDEVADQKRTDIRLAAGEHKAVIEIKLADRRWSFTDLKSALKNQLVGQYLRHRHGRAGCLLLIYDGSKGWWCEGRRRMKFDQMIQRLQEIAREIEIQHGHELLITVRGLDLRDPLSAV